MEGCTEDFSREGAIFMAQGWLALRPWPFLAYIPLESIPTGRYCKNLYFSSEPEGQEGEGMGGVGCFEAFRGLVSRGAQAVAYIQHSYTP
jgi:hypothetical protein